MKSLAKQISELASHRLNENANMNLLAFATRHMMSAGIRLNGKLTATEISQIKQIQKVMDATDEKYSGVYDLEFSESDNEDDDQYNFDLELKSRDEVLEDDIETIISSFKRVGCEVEDVIDTSKRLVEIQFIIPLEVQSQKPLQAPRWR